MGAFLQLPLRCVPQFVVFNRGEVITRLETEPVPSAVVHCVCCERKKLTAGGGKCCKSCLAQSSPWGGKWRKSCLANQSTSLR
jgi:hypothetical protein